jgi:ubiquitin-protein ligase
MRYLQEVHEINVYGSGSVCMSVLLSAWTDLDDTWHGHYDMEAYSETVLLNCL